MSLATSYARALFEAAQEGGMSADKLNELDQQLGNFVGMMKESRDLRVVLLGPVMTGKDKVDVIKAISQKAGFSQILQNFLFLLAAKQRLSLYQEIRNAFSDARLAAEGGVSGRLVSAEPMSDAEVSGLATAVGRKLGKKVAFLASTDASLLAGMKVTVNGVTYDGTLKSQLLRLRIVGGSFTASLTPLHSDSVAASTPIGTVPPYTCIFRP